MKGKLIVIEGTDCSGKETQTKLLVSKLKDQGIPVVEMSFPMYDTPTGRIIGSSYLGKKAYGKSLFEEGIGNVDPKVAALYYAADRKYNINKVFEELEKGNHVILDRYVYSNMAHQGGKILDTDERMNMYAWLDILEFKLLELPKPDIAVFLHMPTEISIDLLKTREEEPDQAEMDHEQLRLAENAYKELAGVYKWHVISCFKEKLLSIEEINKLVYDKVFEQLVRNN